MIHVPDVSATVDWYTSIGFKLIRHNDEDGAMKNARIAFCRQLVIRKQAPCSRTFWSVIDELLSKAVSV